MPFNQGWPDEISMNDALTGASAMRSNLWGEQSMLFLYNCQGFLEGQYFRLNPTPVPGPHMGAEAAAEVKPTPRSAEEACDLVDQMALKMQAEGGNAVNPKFSAAPAQGLGPLLPFIIPLVEWGGPLVLQWIKDRLKKT